jgi:hypothetical protein
MTVVLIRVYQGLIYISGSGMKVPGEKEILPRMSKVTKPQNKSLAAASVGAD